MPAPSGIVWGPEVASTSSNNAGRLGIYMTVSTSGTSATVSVQVWFWSRYGVRDQYNTVYFDWNSSSANTSRGNVSINHSVSSGSGWSTSNQTQIYSASNNYTRTSSNQTVTVAARLSTIEVIGQSISFSTSTTVPAIQTHTVSYNANGGTGAPASQTKVYGYVLTLSTQVPTRAGYKFLGWGTSSTDTTPDYQPGGQYGADVDITLYAIWEAAELIDFTLTISSLSIPANSGKSAASVPAKSITVVTSGTSAVASTNYYVRARRLDGTTITTLGPYKRSSTTSVSVSIPSSHILNALQTQGNESQIQFQIQICTGDNSFSSAITNTKTVTIPLSNFSYLNIVSAIAYRDKSNSNRNTFKISLSYASSYGNMTGLKPTITCSTISKTYSGSSLTKSGASYSTSGRTVIDSAEYVAAADNTTTTTTVSISVTDGITTQVVNTRMLSINADMDIYIFESDNHCEANEFIESDELLGFDQYGNCYAPEFIENSVGAFIDETYMEYGELVER